MGYSLEVTSENFATEVIEASFNKLILVDFFATWCGPCQMLKPLLEKLVKEYDFILAKVDIDQNPDLANHFGIEGVPDVRVVRQGEIMPGFVGVLPEPQLRNLLEQFNLKSALEQGLEDIQTALASQNSQEAQALFDQLLSQYPSEINLRLQAAHFLIRLHETEKAQALLSQIQEDQREFYSQAQALKHLIALEAEIEPSGTSELDQRYGEACRFTLAENYEAALSLFLDIVGTSRKFKEDGARKAMLTIFELLGDDHPLTKEYRKQLMLNLY